jgi:hypothetical protein
VTAQQRQQFGMQRGRGGHGASAADIGATEEVGEDASRLGEDHGKRA